MLQGQIAGRNDFWAIRWRASVILNDIPSVYSSHSLTHDIGLDGGGAHSGVLSARDFAVSNSLICLEDIALAHSEAAPQPFARFNRGFMLEKYKQQLVRRLRKVHGVPVQMACSAIAATLLNR